MKLYLQPNTCHWGKLKKDKALHSHIFFILRDQTKCCGELEEGIITVAFFFLLQAWKNKHVIVLLDWHEFMLMGSWIRSTVDKDNAF